MGTYFKKPFGNNHKAAALPFYKHSAAKPEMWNTMSRTPNPYDSVAAHDFLDKFTNIKWHPYNMNKSADGGYLQKIFQISIRRGILPWRRDNLCIGEPYHPDRVARQFILDQIIPFPPLTSLYTRDDVGVAHAFWTHLLRLEPEGSNYFPDDKRACESSVMWDNWWKKFMTPVACISNELRNGNLNGRVPYDVRKKNKYALQRHIRTRNLSDSDFHVIKRVDISRHEQHLAAIVMEEVRVMNRWQLILHDYLHDDAAAAHPVQSNEQRNLSSGNAAAGTSSAHPLEINSDIPEIAPDSNGKRCRESALAAVGEEERLPPKRKLDFSAESESSGLPMFDDATESDFGTLFSKEHLDSVLAGENGHCLDDDFFSSICGVDYQAGGSGVAHSSLMLNVAENVPPTPNALDFSSTLHGSEQDGRSLTTSEETIVVSGQNSQMGHNFITIPYLNATDEVVQSALKGLNPSNLCDPERRSMLDEISKTLPGYIPQLAKAQGVLDQLVTLSSKLEANQNVFQKVTEQENHARTEATLEIQSREGVVKTAAEELSSGRKRHADQAALVANLKAQLEEASILLKITEEEKQLQKAHSDHELALKEHKEKLQHVDVGHNQKLTELQQQATTLKLEADQLIGNLQKWRSL